MRGELGACAAAFRDAGLRRRKRTPAVDGLVDSAGRDLSVWSLVAGLRHDPEHAVVGWTSRDGRHFARHAGRLSAAPCPSVVRRREPSCAVGHEMDLARLLRAGGPGTPERPYDVRALDRFGRPAVRRHRSDLRPRLAAVEALPHCAESPARTPAPRRTGERQHAGRIAGIEKHLLDHHGVAVPRRLRHPPALHFPGAAAVAALVGSRAGAHPHFIRT